MFSRRLKQFRILIAERGGVLGTSSRVAVLTTTGAQAVTLQAITRIHRAVTMLLALTIGVWMLPINALAVDLYGVSVKSVGAQNGSLAVIRAPAAAASSCPLGYMYIDLTGPSGRAMLNTLMLAKSLDKTVFIRFDLSGPAGSATVNQCTIWLVMADFDAG